MSPGAIKRALFILSILLCAAVVIQSTGIAETDGPQKSVSRKKSMDPAKSLIDKQRSYVYERNKRDVFSDIFVNVTPAPTYERTPGTTPTGGPSTTKTPDQSAIMKVKAERDVAAIKPVLEKHLEQRQYKLVIAKARELEARYSMLGRELAAVLAPLVPVVEKANTKLAQMKMFAKLADSIVINSIALGERSRSAIINGTRLVLVGDNISELFGENAPRDLRIVDIKRDHIVIGSKDLGLTQKILFDSSASKPEK